MTKRKYSNCDKTYLKLWQNPKANIAKKSNYDKTQKLKLWQNLNSNSDNTQKLKFWQFNFWPSLKQSFGKNNFTPQQLMRCTLGSILQYSRLPPPLPLQTPSIQICPLCHSAVSFHWENTCCSILICVLMKTCKIKNAVWLPCKMQDNVHSLYKKIQKFNLFLFYVKDRPHVGRQTAFDALLSFASEIWRCLIVPRYTV